MRNNYKKSKGFTLIELLVVIAIIGLLASIVLVSLNSARKKARDTKRLSDFRQIRTALEMYYDDNQSYPGVDNQWFDINACDGAYTDLSTVLAPNYISSVPQDPLGSSRCNWYRNRNSGEGYLVTFRPENTDLLAEDEDCYAPASWYCVGFNW